MPFPRLATIVLLAGALSGVAASAARFPDMVASDLDGRSVHLPDGLASRTILFVAFAREQQAEVDTWVTGLKLGETGAPWLELPVIDDPGLLGRWAIDSGMRNGVHDHDRRRHVVTLYTDTAAFRRALGIVDTATISVAVVGPDGRVVTMERGRFTPDAGLVVRRALAGE